MCDVNTGEKMQKHWKCYITLEKLTVDHTQIQIHTHSTSANHNYPKRNAMKGVQWILKAEKEQKLKLFLWVFDYFRIVRKFKMCEIKYCVKWVYSKLNYCVQEPTKAKIKAMLILIWLDRCVNWLGLYRNDAERLDLYLYWWVRPKKAKANTNAHMRILAASATVLFFRFLAWFLVYVLIEWQSNRMDKWQKQQRNDRNDDDDDYDEDDEKSEKKPVNLLKQKWN